tara:strand:- start:5480 stop:5647 length:168 start_codon:yes stop_codon:yes gene_type:complete
MKNELNEYLLSRIIIDLTKIKKILEDSSQPDVIKTANEEIDNLIEKIQDIPVNDG